MRLFKYSLSYGTSQVNKANDRISIKYKNANNIIKRYNMAKLSEIKGITIRISYSIEAQGIKTVEALLEACATSKGRKQLAANTGLADKDILTWANRADLSRVKALLLKMLTCWKPLVLIPCPSWLSVILKIFMRKFSKKITNIELCLKWPV